MPRIKNPRDEPITISLPDNIFIGYDVRLGDEDRVTAYWLIPEANGTMRSVTVDVVIASTINAANAVFNASKDEVG